LKQNRFAPNQGLLHHGVGEEGQLRVNLKIFEQAWKWRLIF